MLLLPKLTETVFLRPPKACFAWLQAILGFSLGLGIPAQQTTKLGCLNPGFLPCSLLKTIQNVLLEAAKARFQWFCSFNISKIDNFRV